MNAQLEAQGKEINPYNPWVIGELLKIAFMVVLDLGHVSGL